MVASKGIPRLNLFLKKGRNSKILRPNRLKLL